MASTTAVTLASASFTNIVFSEFSYEPISSWAHILCADKGNALSEVINLSSPPRKNAIQSEPKRLPIPQFCGIDVMVYLVVSRRNDSRIGIDTFFAMVLCLVDLGGSRFPLPATFSTSSLVGLGGTTMRPLRDLRLAAVELKVQREV